MKEEIKDIICIIQPSFEDSNIKLNFKYKGNIYIRGDRKKLKQAVINILYNARDAIIVNNIKEGVVNINVKGRNKNILIMIEDNGGGIPLKIIDRIFDLYFTTKGNFKGTGVGLYMSKIIIEEHFYGKLNAFNSKNGAIFNIEIPRESEER